MQIPVLLDHFILRDYHHVLTCHIFASSHLFLLILVFFFTWVKTGLLLIRKVRIRVLFPLQVPNQLITTTKIQCGVLFLISAFICPGYTSLCSLLSYSVLFFCRGRSYHCSGLTQLSYSKILLHLWAFSPTANTTDMLSLIRERFNDISHIVQKSI